MIARLWLCLALFLSSVACASADEGAYPVLLSMGRAAGTDRGPQAGELPHDSSGARPFARSAPTRGEVPRGVAPDAGPALGELTEPAAPASEPFAAAGAGVFSSGARLLFAPEEAAPSPQAARMKRWAMRFFRLAPSSRRAPSEPFVPPQTRPLPARATVPADHDDGASRAGARRGFSELLAVASCDLP